MRWLTKYWIIGGLPKAMALLGGAEESRYVNATAI
jgi:hypothetical protein